jgi:hypothetical protein
VALPLDIKGAWLDSAARNESQTRLVNPLRGKKIKVKGFRPRASRLLGEFLLPDDAKETKRSDARDLAGLRPDTPLLSRNEMDSLELPPLRSGQTGEPKGLSFRLARAFRHDHKASLLRKIAMRS